MEGDTDIANVALSLVWGGPPTPPPPQTNLGPSINAWPGDPPKLGGGGGGHLRASSLQDLKA